MCVVVCRSPLTSFQMVNRFVAIRCKLITMQHIVTKPLSKEKERKKEEKINGSVRSGLIRDMYPSGHLSTRETCLGTVCVKRRKVS